MTTNRFIVGDRVAEYRTHNLHDSVRITTVERTTVTQYVTATGNRYRIDNGRQVGNHYGGELLPVDDKRVRRTMAVNALAALRSDIERKLKDLRLDGAVADLDEIAELVAKARALVVAAKS